MEAKDAIAALENQRNAALTDNVQLFCALQEEKRKTAELEKKLAELEKPKNE